MRVFLLLLLFSGAANAELALDIHGFSKHFGTDEEYNETNPGLGIAYGGEHINAIAGFYKNSFNERATYAGVEGLTSGAIRFGVALGVAYGYTTQKPDYFVIDMGDRVIHTKSYDSTTDAPTLTPMLAPIIEIGGAVSARFMYLPETDESPSVATLSARIRF